MAGKTEAALAHISATEREFEQSLGELPTKALRLAARTNIADAPKGISQSAVVESLIKAGTAAVAAGAIDAGLDCLRQAAAKSEAGTDGQLIARAFHELGSALVHGIRGFDDEGAIMLRRAADKAIEVGASRAAAASLRELGYIEALAGRRPAAADILNEALGYADTDDEALAGIHSMIGFNLVDWGKIQRGLSHFEQSLAFARKCGSQRREIWALGVGAWGQIRGGHLELADEWLTDCITQCDQIRWVAFQPWPQALLFEARMMQGRVDNSASDTLDEARVLSIQLGDPCWEAAIARSIAWLHENSGDLVKSIDWLSHARERCCSVTDIYAGLLVEILADQHRLYQKLDRPDKASLSARELVSLAARTHADAHIKTAMAAVSEFD
jgi:tetratricopeptide (TPR) repeat protein